jgi:hypothetical protein
LKLDAPASQAPAEPISEPANDAGFDDLDTTENPVEEPTDDKPFDDEPFDAGVEADEDTDPKKFIEQLTGKLGQSLRTYNEEQGQPDFELEKFAINSLLSATHTSEMDEEDKNDIIKKVNTAGNDSNDSNDSDMGSDDSSSDNSNDSNDGDNSGDDFNSELGDTEKPEDLEEFQIYENENLFLDEPKKNNMFQPGSNDKLNEVKPCWKGYKQVGMKEKDGKEVPNCVPINENYGFVKSAIQSASGDKVEQRGEDDYGRPLYWSLSDDNVNYFIGDGDNGDELIVKYNAVNGENRVIGNLKHYGGSPRPKDLPGETLYEDEFGFVEMDSLNEGKYDDKPLNKPMKGDVKKFKVYVKNKKGNVVKVNFGDPNMEIKRDDPERRKSFRARHKCSEAKDKTTPKYWSCKMWSKTPVSKMVSEDLIVSEKNSIFGKNYIVSKLHETFNQDDVMNNSEPQTAPMPVTTPTKPIEQPSISPSRRNKPFLPMPESQPDPKAEK